MLDMGFAEQVHQLLLALPPTRQSLFFSATVPPSIEKLAAEKLRDPVFVAVGQTNTPNASVRQTILWVENAQKKKRLFTLLNDERYYAPPVVVFVESRMGADLLADAVEKQCATRTVSLHGGLTQEERTNRLKAFLQEEAPIIVATGGLLGRGLDLPGVTQVINFDMPSTVEDYVHQIGRAGRLGAPGWAVSFINNDNKNLFFPLVEMLEPLKVALPPEVVNSPSVFHAREKIRAKEAREERKRTGVAEGS
eukprot:Colp12_sorted_trinity150504_noHs@13987